ncbi:MAG: VirB8/TrbF family protein [Endozoicomonas sp. (ex Botrylloides leachii)]|nr:VirB8/TrbF family protein [Endozoicomonas sp. (ex Botrylloides leachii)]
MSILSKLKHPAKDSQDPKKWRTPYLTARRSWNDHTARLKTEKLFWQLAALLCLMITLASVGGLIYIGSQSKFVPYIVEVDKLGKTVVYGAAQHAKTPSKLVTRAEVAAFITHARMITPDAELQRKAIFDVYSKLDQKDAAFVEMNDFYQHRNVFQKAARETVSVQISTVIPETKTTWEVEWVEIVRDRSGTLTSKSNWRAQVSIYYSPADQDTSEEQLLKNPNGLFISNFAWSKQV